MTQRNKVWWRVNITFHKSDSIGGACRLLADVQQSSRAPGVFARITNVMLQSTCSIPACNEIVCFLTFWLCAAMRGNFYFILNEGPRRRFV